MFSISICSKSKSLLCYELFISPLLFEFTVRWWVLWDLFSFSLEVCSNCPISVDLFCSTSCLIGYWKCWFYDCFKVSLLSGLYEFIAGIELLISFLTSQYISNLTSGVSTYETIKLFCSSPLLTLLFECSVTSASKLGISSSSWSYCLTISSQSLSLFSGLSSLSSSIRVVADLDNINLELNNRYSNSVSPFNVLSSSSVSRL